jgi:hypothetical protein
MTHLDIQTLDGLLDSLINRSLIAKMLLERYKEQEFNTDLFATLLEDNFIDCQCAIDNYCIKDECNGEPASGTDTREV